MHTALAAIFQLAGRAVQPASGALRDGAGHLSLESAGPSGQSSCQTEGGPPSTVISLFQSPAPKGQADRGSSAAGFVPGGASAAAASTGTAGGDSVSMPTALFTPPAQVRPREAGPLAGASTTGSTPVPGAPGRGSLQQRDATGAVSAGATSAASRGASPGASSTASGAADAGRAGAPWLASAALVDITHLCRASTRLGGSPSSLGALNVVERSSWQERLYGG